MRKPGLTWLAVVAIGVAPPAGPASAGESPPPMVETVYLTVDQALRETFPAAARFEVDRKAIAPELRARLQRDLGGPVANDSLLVRRAFAASGAFLGYAVVSEETGKYRPITFMVGTTPRLEVEKVTILVYRESHGGDVRRPRFLNQYRGRDFGDPIRVNRDIVNISGATLSVRSLNFGVKKVLGLLEALYAPEAAAARKEP